MTGRRLQEVVGHPNLILETMWDIVEAKGYTFKSNPKRLQAFNEWDGISCWFAMEGLEATFKLQQMPGCCAVLTVSYVNVRPYTQENFDTVLKVIEEAAYEAGFGSVVLTQCVRPDLNHQNESWVKCLDRGWVISNPFVNAKSGNSVVYITKDMEQPGKRAGMEIAIED